MAITIAEIYRYPVKGLSAERLNRVALTPGQCLPEDRRFALARASSPFDPERPQWLSKTNFLMLMENEKLAQLRTRFDPASGDLHIASNGREVLRVRITEAEGRHRVDAFFATFLQGELTGAPRLVEAPGHAFADARRKTNAATDKYVSLVNLASVSALGKVMDVAVDPMRFRANFHVSGVDEWKELDWLGGEINLGGARLRVVSAITRCAATHVNPVTAARDLDIVGSLRRSYGHINMGIYAEVLDGGAVAEGDELRVAGK